MDKTRMINSLDMVKEILRVKDQMDKITESYNDEKIDSDLYVRSFYKLQEYREDLVNRLCRHILAREGK